MRPKGPRKRGGNKYHDMPQLQPAIPVAQALSGDPHAVAVVASGGNQDLPTAFGGSIPRAARTTHIRPHYLGAMDVRCSACSALHFKQEKVREKSTFDDCCRHSRIQLEQSDSDFPPLLKQLFLRQDPRWRSFQERIRSLNSSLSFASVNCTRATEFRQQNEAVPYVFRIQGKVYCLFNTGAHPQEELAGYGGRKYGQLYICDPDEADQHRRRISANQDIDFQLCSDLDQLMRNVSPHARAYRLLRDVEEAERNRMRDLGLDEQAMPNIQLVFNTSGVDLRVYNPPAANEVAAIFVQNPDGLIPPEDLVVTTRGGELRRISSLDRYVDALTYPLFNPTGRPGWTKDMQYMHLQAGDKRRIITRREYLSYNLADRDNVFNPIHLGGRLTQEYIVVNYARMESDRLLWLSEHQNELRAAQYSVQNQARQLADELNVTYEAVKILPSTHPGSPRYMQKQYQNAMAIVRRYGRPDIFLTITCNPSWREVKENCELRFADGTTVTLTAGDRPTILSRVFHLKKRALLDEIKNGLFGVPLAHVHVVEYQKRGLPHAHFLITLADGHKLNTPERVDAMMSAEIPDINADPELYEMVKKHMIHGPCHGRLWSPCKKNGACDKKFPKQYQETTTFNENAYVHLKRPNNGRIVDFGGGRVADNRYVVPYCPYLLRRYNAHINCEVVAGLRAVKYLYKYIYKGLDRADVEVTGDSLVINEIDTHLSARYVSPPEAAMRILGKPLQGKSHAVLALHIHLPGERAEALDPEDEGVEENDDEDRDAGALNIEPYATDPVPPPAALPPSKSMLHAYFKLNREDPAARNKTYVEIPEHYRWDGARGLWIRRAPGNRRVIGRIHAASVTKPELVRLRLLLLHVKAALSFEDLRRDPFNGNLIHPSFGAACLARGLIVADEEWTMCMEEASFEKMPRQLRRLFVTILVHNQPSDPLSLWERFQLDLSEDYRRSSASEQDGIDRAYHDIVQQIRAHGLDLAAHFPDLPEPRTPPAANAIDVNKERQLGMALYDSLTSEQRLAVDGVLKHVEDLSAGVWRRPRCVFINGEGGTGKSHCYKAIFHLLRSANQHVVVCASTGVAATVLPSARTAHKTFALPVPLQPHSESAISEHRPPMELLQAVCVLWDEITAANRYGFEAVDRKLRSIRGLPDLPFGGMVFVTGGDWKQVHPILPRAPTSEAIALSVKRSPLWRFFEEALLSVNMRARDDPQWAQYLLRVGNGLDFAGTEGEIYLPDEILSSGDLVHDVYHGLFARQMPFDELIDYLSERAIIAPLNQTCEHYNLMIVHRLPGDAVEHVSVDEIVADTVEEGEYYSTEFLNSLDPTELPQHRMQLKPGVVCMLLRNLRVHEGLCNGSRLLVTKVGRRFVEVMHMTGPLKGQCEYLPRISLTSNDGSLPFKFKRTQYPIKPCYAFSVNKAQGQSLRFCGVDLTYDCFSHGQLYVALSRVGSSSNIRVKLRPDKRTVRNVVEKELLRTVR